VEADGHGLRVGGDLAMLDGEAELGGDRREPIGRQALGRC
jgi:hypothetical protein